MYVMRLIALASFAGLAAYFGAAPKKAQGCTGAENTCVMSYPPQCSDAECVDDFDYAGCNCWVSWSDYTNRYVCQCQESCAVMTCGY
jgi:hypothetical protein